MKVAVASFEANSRARMSTRFFCRRSWTPGGTLISVIMHDSAVETKTLPFSWYGDQDILRLEQERIFRHAWQYVGHSGQLDEPGDRFPARVGDIPVLVVRAEDGVRAFLHVCRHRG